MQEHYVKLSKYTENSREGITNQVDIDSLTVPVDASEQKEEISTHIFARSEARKASGRRELDCNLKWGPLVANWVKNPVRIIMRDSATKQQRRSSCISNSSRNQKKAR